MTFAWKNSPAVRSLLAWAFMLLLTTALTQADEPISDQEYGVNAMRVAIFPTVQFEENTLKKLVDEFDFYTSKIDCGRRVKVNVVLDTSRLAAAQLSALISVHEKDITLEEMLCAICKGLGIGYRMDAHAIFISSRVYVGLPNPPSKRVAMVRDGVVIVGKDKS